MKSRMVGSPLALLVLGGWFVWLAQAQAMEKAAGSATGSGAPVYFCPAKSSAYLGRSAPVACSEAQCVGGKSAEMTPQQRKFLESAKGECRSLTQQEKDALLSNKAAAR